MDRGERESRLRGQILALGESVMFISTHNLKVTWVFAFFTSNTLHLVSTTKAQVVPPLTENRQSWSSCKPLFTGLDYCTSGAYSNASSPESASSCLLTGDTRSEMLDVPTQLLLTSYIVAIWQGEENLLCVLRGVRGLHHLLIRYSSGPLSQYT